MSNSSDLGSLPDAAAAVEAAAAEAADAATAATDNDVWDWFLVALGVGRI
jgi:hypothetical protein